MKNDQTFKHVTGYFEDEPNLIHTFLVCLGQWDQQNEQDNDVFFYMDNLPLSVGSTIAGNFKITGVHCND